MAEESKTKRLCSEIQLFDLCSKDTCKRKNGRFCSDDELLAKFEAISEEDVLRDQFIDDSDDYEDSDDADYDDGCFDDSDGEDEDRDE
jgi:hypothetical protein